MTWWFSGDIHVLPDGNFLSDEISGPGYNPFPWDNPSGGGGGPGAWETGYDVLDSTPPPDAPPTPPLNECATDHEALRAADEILAELGSHPNEERGYVLVRNTDGSIRMVGPFSGSRDNEGNWHIQWQFNKSILGITSYNQVVGLVHNHPTYGGDAGASNDPRHLSDDDVNVTRFLIGETARTDSGQLVHLPMNDHADPAQFRNYVLVGSTLYQVDDVSTNDAGGVVTGQCGS